jgi:iron complex outermembrane receptor protein
MFMRISRLATTLSSLAVLAAYQASAQEAAQQAPSDDIVVTARRTSERLQDVPVAVTAISGDAIERRNLRSVADIQALTPSLNFTSVNAQGSKSAIALRGQRQSALGINVDPSVGVYVNELYMARAAIDTSLYDLESVQILKGPQGTLFGRNTTGGAVLVSTKKPGDYLGAYVRGQVEDPWGYVLEGALNVPLGEGNGLRIAGIRQYRRGYNEISNQNMRSDNRNRYGGRATLSLASGGLKTLFVGDYFRWRENGVGTFPLARFPVFGSAATAPIYAAFDAALAVAAASDDLKERRTGATQRPFSRGRNYSALNVTTYDLTDGILFKNIVGYASSNTSDSIDYDATPVPVLSTAVTSGQKQFSEEAQIQGKSFDKALDWIVGAYYFRETGWESGMSNTLTNPNTTIARNNNLFSAENSARSVFAHASYLLPVGLPAHIFGGLRRGNDKRSVLFRTRLISATGGITCSVAGAPATLGVVGGACELPASKSFNSTTWDVGLDVKPTNDLLLYGSVSRGYRTGGFNGRATTAFTQVPYNPETVLNYEAGFKYSGLVGDMRTTLNVAAYHSKYDDIQQNIVFINSVGGISSSVINAAKARINGVEAELSIHPVRVLTLSGFYSLTDAKYTEFDQLGVDISYNKFAGVPRHTGGAALTWDVFEGAEAGNLQLNVNYRFSSGFQLDPINLAGSYAKAYSVWNGSLRLEKAFGTPATLEVYGKNIFDKTYTTGGFSSAAIGFSSQTIGDPRVIGVGFRLPFGGE